MRGFSCRLGFTTLSICMDTAENRGLDIACRRSKEPEEPVVAVISLHSRKGKILAGATIGALAWGLVAGLYFGQLFETFELGSYDHLSRLHAARMSIPDNIVLVVVDQSSLEAAQRQGIGWPWPRQMYAPIVHFGALSGARAVVFGILFTEPST